MGSPRNCLNMESYPKTEAKVYENNDSKEPEKKTLFQRFCLVATLMTIEPMMIMQGIGMNISRFPEDQMILYKICKEPQFNLTDDFCKNIEANTNTTSYDEVEAEVVSFNNVITLSEHLVPILLSFYIGSWSDHFGRKPFLAFCMLGKVVGAIFNLLNAIYLEEWNRWVWVATVMPIQNISGGFLTFIMMTYSFIADNSTRRQRTIRLGVLNFCWQISKPLSLPLGAWLYDSGGYVCVMGTSLLLYVIASFLGLYKLWGFQEKIGKEGKIPLSKLVSPKHVTDSVKTTFQRRPDKKRSYLISMLFVMLMHLMPMFGEMYCQFMYTKRTFQWKVDTYSYYSMVKTIIESIGMATLMPIFHYFNINDNLIILLSFMSAFSAQMFRGFATKSWMMFASAGVDFATSILSAPVRAQITSCVYPHETGKVFAMLASVESLVPIIASTVFTRMYNVTAVLHYPWPGSFYFVGAGSILLGLVVTLYVHISLGCSRITPLQNNQESQQAKQANLDRMNSNLHPEDTASKKRELFLVAYKNLPIQ